MFRILSFLKKHTLSLGSWCAVILRLLVWTTCLFSLLNAQAQTVETRPSAIPAAQTPTSALPLQGIVHEPASIKVLNRTVTVLRAPLMGISPQSRAEQAQKHIARLLNQQADAKITVKSMALGEAVHINDEIVFIVQTLDANAAMGETPQMAAAEAVKMLTKVAQETQEQRDKSRMLRALLHAIVYTTLSVLGIVILRWSTKKLALRVSLRINQRAESVRIQGVRLLNSESVLLTVRQIVKMASWLVIILIGFLWLSSVLNLFPYTRAWGEDLSSFLIDSTLEIVNAIVASIPNLFTIAIIIFIAKWVARIIHHFFERLGSQTDKGGWLDADLIAPTRRISIVVVWLFALAMSYPYFPGANTQAFKGISVLAGLMISVGGASQIGQAVSGLMLIYARVFRAGEYVCINDHEGTVMEVGVICTRIRTGMGEEIFLPNSMVLAATIKNYSRTVQGSAYIVDTVVTIGYDTPWRQVHAMLLEAARRTPGVMQEPLPRVFQTALSDFYPQYRLVCQASPKEPRPRAEVLSQLHAHIQDVFNSYGVQIMSPHYLADPAHEKIVPKDKWFLDPAKSE